MEYKFIRLLAAATVATATGQRKNDVKRRNLKLKNDNVLIVPGPKL